MLLANSLGLTALYWVENRDVTWSECELRPVGLSLHNRLHVVVGPTPLVLFVFDPHFEIVCGVWKQHRFLKVAMFCGQSF